MKKIILLIATCCLLSTIMADNASIGSVTIDGKIYNQISFRPEYTFGKWGLGLDIYFYLDDEGNFYEKPWDFSKDKAIENIIDKIYYLRYNQPSDKIHFRLGGMPSATLGYGIVVDRYSNTIEYPNIRRLGLEFNYNGESGIETQFIISDIKRSPGLIAIRASFPIASRLNIGIFGATDLNMAKGLTDTDDDGYPDYFDDFPNDEDNYSAALYDANINGWNQDGGLCSNDIVLANFDSYEDCVCSYLGNSCNTFDTSDYDNDDISAIGLDLSLKLTKKLTLYSQFAQLIGDKIESEEGEPAYSENLGWGAVPLGFQVNFGPEKLRFSTSLETRINSRHFMYSFWDQTYELNRAEPGDENKIITKRNKLEIYGELKGLYFNTNISMLNLLNFDLSYQNMVGETWNADNADFDDEQSNKSFLASLNFNTSRIPKLRLAEVYYQRNNDSDPFDFDNPTTNTVHGYNLGIELSSGVVLVYKGRTTYINNDGEIEPNFTLQVETQIAL